MYIHSACSPARRSMSTITSPRRSGSVRGIEGGVEKLLAAFKKKSENNINQRPFVPRRVATAPVSRRIHHQRERVVHPERNSAPARAESMATLTSSSIVSPRRSGSIRGVEGSVEKLLASFEKKTDNFDHSPLMRRIKSEETSDKKTGKKGKVVLYVTSVQMIRSTRELCKQVLHVLKAYRVQCSVKDVYLHPAYSKELSERLGGDENVSLPQLFVDGEHVGDGASVMEMNEAGGLEELLAGFMNEAADMNSCEDCALCGGKGFIVCLWCKGTKKGMRNNFGDLKCTVCNENALQECPGCSLG